MNHCFQSIIVELFVALSLMIFVKIELVVHQFCNLSFVMIVRHNVIKYSEEQIRDYQIIVFMSRIPSFISGYFVDNLFDFYNSQRLEKKRDVKTTTKVNQVVIDHLRTSCYSKSCAFDE